MVYHKVTLFLIVVFENFQNLSLKCLWDGSGVGCNVAQPNSPQNVLADGPRARQYTLDASEDGAALLRKCSRVKGRRCPAFRDTFIQPMEADLDQTTFFTQGQALFGNAIEENTTQQNKEVKSIINKDCLVATINGCYYGCYLACT